MIRRCRAVIEEQTRETTGQAQAYACKSQVLVRRFKLLALKTNKFNSDKKITFVSIIFNFNTLVITESFF